MAEVDPIVERPRSRLHVLDGLRLLAAVMVLLFHFTARDSTSWGAPPAVVFPALEPISTYGALGVQLFFMISGFVVLLSAWGRRPAQFIASRVSRLYPAYWFAVLSTAALLYFARPITPGGRWEAVRLPGVLVNLTMAQTPLRVADVDGVYWTLWEEAKFYLLVLVLCVVGVTARRVLIAAIAWPAASVLVGVLHVPVLGAILGVNTSPYFALGMVLYLIHARGLTLSTALVGLVDLALIALNIPLFVMGWLAAFTRAGGNPVVVFVLFVLMAAAILFVTGARFSRTSWPWLTVAGSITYPLYLLHDNWGFWLIDEFHGVLAPPLLVLALLVLFAVVAYLVSRYVERPVARPLRLLVERAVDTATSWILRHRPIGRARYPKDAEFPRTRD